MRLSSVSKHIEFFQSRMISVMIRIVNENGWTGRDKNSYVDFQSRSGLLTNNRSIETTKNCLHREKKGITCNGTESSKRVSDHSRGIIALH